jgi:hypothetical protein
MKNIEKKLIDILNEFKWTQDEINTDEDLYDFTMWNKSVANATFEECENAIYAVFHK